jgi:hypothetical protein
MSFKQSAEPADEDEHMLCVYGQRKLRLEARQCHGLAVGRTWISRGGVTDLQLEQPEHVRHHPSTVCLPILPRPPMAGVACIDSLLK